MKQIVSLILSSVVLGFSTAVTARESKSEFIDVSRSVEATASTIVKSSDLIVEKPTASIKADNQELSYKEPDFVLYLGMSEDFHAPSSTTTIIPAYKELTWINNSTGYPADTEYQWSYIDPTYASFKKMKTVTKDLSLCYHPRSPYGSIISPELMLKGEFFGFYTNVEFYPGGSTHIDDYDFGLNPSPNSGKPDYSMEKMPSYISAPCYTYTKDSPNADWVNELGDKFKHIEAFGNIYPQPMAPYSITKAWAYMLVEASAATSIEINVYRVDGQGGINRDERIAHGEAAVKEGKNDIIAADLIGLDEDGFDSTDPIMIDSPVYVEFTGFAGNAAIVSVSPKLVIMDQYKAGEENPYDMNFRITYKTTDNKSVTGEPVWSLYTDDTKTTIIAPANMGVSLAAVIPWCVATGESYSFDATAEGGQKVFNIDSYYDFGKDQTIVKDEANDWFDVEIGTKVDDQTPLTVTVKALEGKGRSGKFTIKAPAVNVEFTVTQGDITGISDIEADEKVVEVNYYDIYGRRLNAAPRSGMYIKECIKADGSSAVVKHIAL